MLDAMHLCSIFKSDILKPLLCNLYQLSWNICGSILLGCRGSRIAYSCVC